MKRIDNDDLDAVLRTQASAASADHESSVTVAETNQALAAVRARLEGAEVTVLRQTGRGSRDAHRQWLVVAAAVALLAVLAGGLLLLDGQDQEFATESTPSASTSPPTTLQTSTTAATTPSSTIAASTTVLTLVTTPETIPPALPPGEVLPFTYTCVPGSTCTQLAATEDGRVVVFDPTDNSLTVYSASGIAETTVPVAPLLTDQYEFLEHVGPDDVAYMRVTPIASPDPISNLIAIPLRGPNAGKEVARYESLDGTGDSVLVPQATGLAVVGCCGALTTRPLPDATVYPYVDSTGGVITSTAPYFRLDLGESGNQLVRTDGDSERAFVLPTPLHAPRDIPTLVATNDGGALGLDYLAAADAPIVTIVRFAPDWPDGSINNADVFLSSRSWAFPESEIVMLEQSGTIIVRTGATFVRTTIEDFAVPSWSGQVVIDPATGVVDVSGLNAYIDAVQPAWAAHPDALVSQLVQQLGPNERLTAEFDQSTGILEIITTGLLDDSVAATRIAAETMMGDDGLLRVTKATYGVQCQPDRGHQDFSVELCV
jgi:hypothetical protein